MSINQLAADTMSNVNARYLQKVNKPQPVPETGFIVGFVRGEAKIEANGSFYFARNNSTGAAGIGSKVSLHIHTQGTNFYAVIPR